jgi:large subunit ribosomal protein L30
MAGKIRVTLRRSMIGEKPKTRQTVRGLGLNKLHSSNDLPDNASVRGMLHKVRHLVDVEETPEERK